MRGKRKRENVWEQNFILPLTTSEAQLINDIGKNPGVFPGLVTGKKEVVRDPESFSPTVIQLCAQQVCPQKDPMDRVLISTRNWEVGAREGTAEIIPFGPKDAESQHRSSANALLPPLGGFISAYLEPLPFKRSPAKMKAHGPEITEKHRNSLWGSVHGFEEFAFQSE